MKQGITNIFQCITRLSLFICVLLVSTSYSQTKEPKHGSILLNPIEFDREGVDLVGEEGFIFVPENRAADKSRMISVHFYRFPAKQNSGLAPVFILPGGPGGSFTYRSFYKHFSGIRAEFWVKELKALNQKRDVVIVNQRGNMRPPGLNTGDWRWGVEKAPVDKLETSKQALARYAKGVREGVEQWTKNGVDLAGYDIMNISEDLEDLRISLGYEKIALRGNSFGSQWSLAYMKRWPQHVDRAMLAGVEPLDFAWDSADWLWKALERLEKRASATRRANIPEGGFLNAFKSVVAKLEEKGIEVELKTEKDTMKVMVGADDVRSAITSRMGRTRRQSLENWPRFIKDLQKGDFRFLAHNVADDKESIYGGSMITALIDNSLGISDKRENVLNAEAAIQWLGDPNGYYKATRKITPTPEVSDDFRFETPIDIPVLMIQGDLDFSTPYENALHLKKFLKNGHLITIVDGTHSAVGEAILHNESEAMKMFAFMDADFSKTVPSRVFESIPERIEMPALDFNYSDEKSLYELMVEVY